MLKTFTVNELQINTVAKKMLLKMIRMYCIILLVMIIANIPRNNFDPVKILFPLCFMVPILALMLYFGFRRYVKTLKDLKIIIDETGLEIKAPMTMYKKIIWRQMRYDEKKDGVIKIYDTSVNAAVRWWMGAGVILIPFEINDRVELVNLINSHLMLPNV